MPSKLLDRKIDALRKRMGSGPLTSNALDREGLAMFGQRWGGALDQPGFKAASKGAPPDRFYVVNTSYTIQSPGVHWVGIYVTRSGVAHVYDSFGRDVDHLLSRSGFGANRRQVNAVGDQHATSALCGHYTLAWLGMVKDQGVVAANAATE